MEINAYSFPRYFRQNTEIHSYDADLNQRLSLASVFNYLQELAWEHARRLKYGYDDLREKGWFWVLSRVEMELYRLPRWTEEVTMITWPRGTDGIFALRDFEFYDAGKRRIIAATSSWLIVNISNRRPVRMNDWYNGFEFDERAALGHPAGKLPETSATPCFHESFKVRTGDIDMNMHVNNVRYVDWAYNTFPLEHFRRFIPAKLTVNFNAELKGDEQVVIERFDLDNNTSLVNINSAPGAKNHCRLEFVWNEDR